MSSNMHLLYFNFVVLLSVCGLRCVGSDVVMVTTCTWWCRQQHQLRYDGNCSYCKPTLIPLSGSKVYVLDGSNYYDLTWDYNTDGRTIKEVQLKYSGTGSVDTTVAGKTPEGQLQVNPGSGYSASRISFTGSLSANVERITFRISNIAQSDNRIFKCELSFNSFDPPDIQSSIELVVVVAPRITLKSQRTVTVDEGNVITLLCVATGNPKPSITWTNDTSVKQQTSITNYTISSAAKQDAGTYTCTARVAVPLPNVQPDSYQVTVIVRYKPQISFLTSNRTVNDGTDVSLSCRADAVPSPTAYNWFKNGVTIPSGSSGDLVNSGQELTVTKVKKGSAGRYSCSSRNDVGTGEERSTFLTVNYAPQTVTVTPNPAAVVKLSQSITLDCTADGYPVPTFSWQFNGAVLSGATQKTYALNNAKVEDAGNYSCEASNFRGKKKAFRVVNVEYAPTATTFTTGTPNNAVVQGTAATLTCSANGYPAPVYTLKHGNTVLVQNSATGTYDISNVQLNTHDGQVYSCQPSNAEGSGPPQSLTVTVHVRPRFNPPQTLPTTKQIKNETQTMDYTCRAEAKPYASIRWMLNGQNLTNIPPYNITERIAGPAASKLFTTFGYLNIKHLTWQQYGNFSCVAINDAGSVKQNTELEVRYRPVVQFPADHPKNLTLAEGETATFNCKTIGNPPTTAHKWQFNGSDLQGEACNNCPTTTLRIGSVERKDEGWYGCVGTNSLGDGPPAKAQLLIKRKPTIDYFPKSVYTVNETNNITMVCGADGVPRPTITWKMSSGRIVGEGEEFHIVAASETDDGVYICFAKNELGDASKGVTLQVQTRPTILTSTPMNTNIPGATGERVDLTCMVKGKPSPTLSWRRDPNGDDLSAIDEKVESITNQDKATTMKIIVTTAGKEVGDKFYCFATNILGNDTQQYIIRERGPPDPPQDVKVVSFTVPGSETVSVNVSWTRGYSGGYDQQFSIHYRKKGSGSDFTEVVIGLPPNNMHTVQQLSPNTEYEFMMQASNQRGNSPTSPLAQVTTPDADEPPPRGTVTATRIADDPTEIVVTWTVTDTLVNKLKLEILEVGDKVGEGRWSVVSGASDMNTSTTQFKVKNLKADAKYKFRLDMRRPGENDPKYVESNEVPAVPIVGTREEPLKNWMIAVIAAVGGVLLIGIVILCLCCFMRRKKSLGADRVNMSQTSSYVVGGPPDVSRSLDTRPRSYGMESVEDDPFIEAHFASMQSMNSTDGKKKKGDSGVNLGYLSQDSVQPQSEMLMNPGSRLSRNHPVAQSTGDLDSAYPARGPQRDFNTLPPYHEPPSFEEAMRQSGRKPKIRKSTGDLTGPGQGRHAGRRPRPSPSDEPTDSSDGETRFTPQRTAPPPPRVRPNELNDDPRYAPVDQQGRVLEPRMLPQGLSTTSAPRNGPIDPTVPYSMPQKKKSTKKPRSEPSEPAIAGRPRPLPLMVGPSFYNASAYKGWPPPQYTPEDRSPAEPMHYPGDLDLDDPVNLPRSERPPDLPPPMAMLPSNRGMSNYHHYPHDGLPEPPAFLRDVVYPPYGRDTQSDSDGPAPYNPPPPSSNRQRKPYVNIHGQLVRPPSRESDEFLRPESLRSSRDALTPEPEMPVRPRQPRGSEFDDRGEPEINYFSYLV